MSNQQLNDALDRAEQALARLEAVAARTSDDRDREARLRSTVREVVAELDSLVAGGGR